MLVSGTNTLQLVLLTYLKAFAPQVGGVVASHEIFVRLLHPSKTLFLISTTSLWILMLSKEKQFSNRYSLSVVTEFGISICFSLLHPEKAASPIAVTLFGISIDFSLQHS